MTDFWKLTISRGVLRGCGKARSELNDEAPVSNQILWYTEVLSVLGTENTQLRLQTGETLWYRLRRGSA